MDIEAGNCTVNSVMSTKPVTIAYSSPGYRSIRLQNDITSHRDAAEVFAKRVARKLFGRRAVVGALRVEGYGVGFFEVSAFVGVPGKDRAVCGRDYRFAVTFEPAAWVEEQQRNKP